MRRFRFGSNTVGVSRLALKLGAFDRAEEKENGVTPLKWARGLKPSTVLYQSARYLREYAEGIEWAETIDGEWPSGSERARDEYQELDSLAWALRSMARYAAWESANARRHMAGLPPKPLRAAQKKRRRA